MARQLFVGMGTVPGDPFSMAAVMKRTLRRQGFRDIPGAFSLPDMLARRGGNCLGLTLLVGAELAAHGHEVGCVLRVNPRDDVHAAGAEHFALLTDPIEGVDCDSRLPEARDQSARFRFSPAEHASLSLRDDRGVERPFECTGLSPAHAGEDPGWAPEAESVRRVSFAELASCIYSERAKALLLAGEQTGVARARRSVLLALRAVRMWPDNREAWAQVWKAARILALGGPHLTRRCQIIAAVAAGRYLSAAADDSLWHFTTYRMTGDERHLDAALARFPSDAEAYYAKHVAALIEPDMDTDDEARERACRGFIIAAWCHAESELFDLQSFYHRHRADLIELFGHDELMELENSFS